MQPVSDDPRQLALAAFAAMPVEQTGLVEYRSAGRVTIIGGPEALQLAAQLPSPLSARVLLLSGMGENAEAAIAVDGQPITISGHLGDFRTMLGEGERAQLFESDLVLDLSPQPLLATALPPPGYIARPADQQQGAASLIDELAGMAGVFEKPEYFRFDSSRCAHARNGVTACTRCLDACPADAIQSLAEQVRVDPYLCQGGGVCAAVCPSGAIGYAYPSSGDLGRALRRMLRVYGEASGKDPLVLFHARETELPELWHRQSNLLPVAVEEVASVSIENWLSAIAWGAAGVVLYLQPEVPASVRSALEEQLRLAGQLLAGMGYPQAALSLLLQPTETPIPDPAMPRVPPATHAAMDDKRTSLFLAIDHLQSQAGQSRRMITLEQGAPFGEAVVDAKRCTLCMACASACPGHALQDGQGEPKLRFVEANCIQCGLCTRTCPENAIWISPRFLFDREARTRPRVLHQDEPFHCVGCGKPFATRSVIERIQAKLSDNWMFQTEQARRRLLMCDDCRVVDVVQDAQAMGPERHYRQ